MTPGRIGGDLVAPLTPSMFQVLLVLVRGEAHGYAIMQEVERQTDGEVHVAPGTLYRSIKQLVTSGMIVECGERPDPTLDDQRRRYYRITAAGQSALESETNRLARLLRLAQRAYLRPARGTE